MSETVYTQDGHEMGGEDQEFTMLGPFILSKNADNNPGSGSIRWLTEEEHEECHPGMKPTRQQREMFEEIKNRVPNLCWRGLGR